MADVQYSEVGQILRNQTKISPSQGIPQSLSSQIVPVIDISADFHKWPTMNRAATNTASASTNTVYTVPSGKRFWLFAAQISLTKNATCDVANGAMTLQGTIDSVGAPILRLPTMTLTAQDTSVNQVFPNPIPFEAGTAITLTQGTFTAGSFIRCAVINGYEETI